MSDRICISSGQINQTEVSAQVSSFCSCVHTVPFLPPATFLTASHSHAQDLVSCCDDCGAGCGGGDPSAAWDWWVSDGIVTEDTYPYAFKPCEHHMNGTKVSHTHPLRLHPSTPQPIISPSSAPLRPFATHPLLQCLCPLLPPPHGLARILHRCSPPRHPDRAPAARPGRGVFHCVCRLPRVRHPHHLPTASSHPLPLIPSPSSPRPAATSPAFINTSQANCLVATRSGCLAGAQTQARTTGLLQTLGTRCPTHVCRCFLVSILIAFCRTGVSTASSTLRGAATSAASKTSATLAHLLIDSKRPKEGLV
jgi:hypothetical protein